MPADGFYEWQQQPGRKGKQPYYIHMRDGSPLAFTGLWEKWERHGRIIESCTILTTAANELMASVHVRMPVILEPHDYTQWMDHGNEDPAALLKPFAAKTLEIYPVSSAVNSPRNDSSACIERRATDEQALQGSEELQ